MGYIDLYLLPIQEARIEEYREQASAFGAVVKEKGALSYREFRADDLDEGFAASAGAGPPLTAAVAEALPPEPRAAAVRGGARPRPPRRPRRRAARTVGPPAGASRPRRSCAGDLSAAQ